MVVVDSSGMERTMQGADETKIQWRSLENGSPRRKARGREQK